MSEHAAGLLARTDAMTTQTPAEALATLHRMVGHVTIANPGVLVASDGPGEQVIGERDLEWLADREEARETRWREGS